MNPTEIEFAVRDLVALPYDPVAFPFELLAIYNTPKATISKLRSGQTNAAKTPGDVLWKTHFLFHAVTRGEDAAAVGDALLLDPLTIKYKPRFILVTDGAYIHIRDQKLDDTCNVEYSRLDEVSDFLLPLARYERRSEFIENPADLKAAKRLAKLYDAILAANPTWSDGNHTHELNLFMTRILFCFYAEDTGIFDVPRLLTNTVSQQTAEDGHDLNPLLRRLFTVMNQPLTERPESISAIDNRFPYINGSLFEIDVPVPVFNRTCRRLFLECGELDWRSINADIFGSMIQTITQPGARGDIGMHYTSVRNIMKVLQPLFLDNLSAAYARAKDSAAKLEALLVRLSTIRIFDPACGSGNFLFIAYTELRKLEMTILRRLGELKPNNPLRLSVISLHNFFGIDTIDFACETAKLSLWIGEYQMNAQFKELFGTARAPLPLGKISTIRNENALATNWLELCAPDDSAETYICSNPPYAGSSNQTPDQKRDIERVFAPLTRTYKNVDYVGCFFIKVTDYVAKTGAEAALVSTNSVCQGEQVGILWPLIYGEGLEITFAYPPFKWQNSASHNAFVFCVIVGLARTGVRREKMLYTLEHSQRVTEIGPYLIPGTTLIVRRAVQPINGLPEMLWGNKPTDGGFLILSPDEYRKMTTAYPESEAYLRRYYGSEDFINGIERWCLWITDDDVEQARRIPPIRKRIEQVREFRLKSRASSTVEHAEWPHRFRQVQDWGKPALLVPGIFSERRAYQSVDFLPARAIISNTAFAIYDAPSYLLSILSSLMHSVWTKAISGRHGMVIGYSSTFVYNTFPLPSLSEDQKRILTDHARAIVRARARHPDKTLAWLYNPETMPLNLLEAHQENDSYIEQFVYGRAFRDDTHRVEHLFAMYARLQAQGQGSEPLLKPERKAIAHA